jgi:hypothetical protein
MIATIILIGLCLLHLYSKGSRKNLYRFTVILMMVFAFFVKPTQGMDLYTHYHILDVMRGNGLQYTVARYPWLFSTLPVYSGFFYIVSFLGFNQALLMITYGLIYGLQFKVLHMAVEDYKLSEHKEKVGAIMILLITNVFFCTTVRNVLAFAVMSYFLYWDLVREKKRIASFSMYVLLCLFHDSVVILLALRLLLLVVNKKIFKPLLVSVLIWPQLLSFIESRLRVSSIAFFQTLAQRVRTYTNEGANELWVGGIANRIMITIYVLVFVIVLIRMIKNHRNNGVNYNLFELFYVMLSLFCIGGLATIAITNRYIYMVAYMLTPAFLIENQSDSGIMLKMGSIIIDPVIALSVALFVSFTVFQYPYFSFGI